MPRPDVGRITYLLTSTIGDLRYVRSPDDFPAAVAGVRSLEAGCAYLIVGDVDLEGDRLSVTAGSTALLGTSSETSSLTSTGLGSGTPLITSTKTLRIQNLTIKNVGTAFSIGGSTDIALDWTALNLTNITTVGDFGDVGNFILTNSSFLGSQGMRFTGQVGTVGFTGSLLQGDGTTADDILEIASTAVVSRRVRLDRCAVVAFGSTSGVNVSASATVPDESFILDTVNFSGGGTYLPGLDYTSNTSLFLRSNGVTNTAVIGSLYMNGNATATTIATVNTPVKIAGTTTANAYNQKFSHSNNRLTYDGAFSETFRSSAVATVTGSANKVFHIYAAVNGTVIPTSGTSATTNAGGRAESITIQGVLQLEPGDYIELWIENQTDSSNLTVEDLNAIIEKATP